MGKFSRRIQDVGIALSELQILREYIDSDPDEVCFRSEVLKDTQRAEKANNNFVKAKISERKAFVTFATTKV